MDFNFEQFSWWQFIAVALGLNKVVEIATTRWYERSNKKLENEAAFELVEIQQDDKIRAELWEKVAYMEKKQEQMRDKQEQMQDQISLLKEEKSKEEANKIVVTGKYELAIDENKRLKKTLRAVKRQLRDVLDKWRRYEHLLVIHGLLPEADMSTKDQAE